MVNRKTGHFRLPSAGSKTLHALPRLCDHTFFVARTKAHLFSCMKTPLIQPPRYYKQEIIVFFFLTTRFRAITFLSVNKLRLKLKL